MAFKPFLHLQSGQEKERKLVSTVPSKQVILPHVSRKSDTIFGQGTMPEPSTSHIGQGVALDAPTAVLVYIYARISQIAEIQTSFYATSRLRVGTTISENDGSDCDSSRDVRRAFHNS